MPVHFVLVLPPVTATLVQVQPEQEPEPQRMYTFVAVLATVPWTLDTVRPVMGTPVVGVPVGEPFS